MKALVTGATGFVGPYLVRHCHECGDDVVAAGDATSGFDILDRDAVADAIRAARPDVVFHLAARSHVGASWADPAGIMRVNVEGTVNVVEAARAAGADRVVVVGSAEEYGRVDGAEPVRESAPLRPLTPYGVSKVAAGFVALQAFLAHGLATIRVRAFGHTGAGQASAFVVPALAQRIADAEHRGHDTVTVGATAPVRDLTDVRDVVRAYRLLAERGAPGEVYNVARGTGVTVGEVAQRLVANGRRPLQLVADDALVRPVDVPFLVGDPAKLRAATGWEPQYSLDDTLAWVLDAAREQAAQGS